MKKIKILMPGLIFLIINFSCANGGNEEGRKADTSLNSTPTGPAPDNSAATNPSLADTLHDNKDTSVKDTGKH